MGKHQLDKVGSRLRSGPWPVVITSEIEEAANFEAGDSRTYPLIKRLKAAGLIAPSVGERMQGEELPWVRGTYWVVEREWSSSYIFRAWLRRHPGQGPSAMSW